MYFYIITTHLQGKIYKFYLLIIKFHILFLFLDYFL
jgi:hypothetical protein